MSNVISLGERRTPPEGGIQTCRDCSCPWFHLVIDDRPGAVAFDRHGAVIGYAGVAVCRECGAEHDCSPAAR
jgi:hypothetical protein